MDYSQGLEELNELLQGISPEDTESLKEIKTLLIEMQRQLVLHEPWTVAHWDKEKRDEYLKQFTPEEQEQMAVRCELEHQRYKETGKGFGND